MYKKFFKRGIDLSTAFIGILILSPIFILVTIALFLSNKGKPFFVQKRPGKNERIFKIIKFKSMNDLKDVEGNLLPDKHRLTMAGSFVRKTSLDELPQLFNVLIGDMSLIGPRPLFIRYLPFYTDEEKLRHSVKPGITGWAQLNGRNTIDWDRRLEMDVYYVRNISFKFDMKILFKTFVNVISSKDVELIPGDKLKTLDTYRKTSK